MRPSDHVDGAGPADGPGEVNQPKLGVPRVRPVLLAPADEHAHGAVPADDARPRGDPGSLVPQRTADPNGVVQYKADHPQLYPVLDKLQVFDTYTSVWFSAIYLLLFVSLIGCIIPRTQAPLAGAADPSAEDPRATDATRGLPQRGGAGRHDDGRCTGTDATTGLPSADHAVTRAMAILKRSGYRVERFGDSVSAERGYLRETGNLVFHAALVGVLLAVGDRRRLRVHRTAPAGRGADVLERPRLVRLVQPGSLVPADRPQGLQPDASTSSSRSTRSATSTPSVRRSDYSATVTSTGEGRRAEDEPPRRERPAVTSAARTSTCSATATRCRSRCATATATWRSQDVVPFLPRGRELHVAPASSRCRTRSRTSSAWSGSSTRPRRSSPRGAFTSSYPDTENPLLTLQVYTGDLGLDDGVPRSVYTLDTKGLDADRRRPVRTRRASSSKPGQTKTLPEGAGSITFDGVKRYVSLDVHHDPSQLWVGGFALLSACSGC